MSKPSTEAGDPEHREIGDVVVVARPTAALEPDLTTLGLPGWSLHQLHDAASVAASIDSWRGRLAGQRLARGDKILALRAPGEPNAAGWIHISYVSHTDRFSGLTIAIGSKQAYVYDLQVSDHVPAGVSTALLTAAVAQAFRDGATHAFGWVETENRPALIALCVLGGFSRVDAVHASASEPAIVSLTLPTDASPPTQMRG